MSLDSLHNLFVTELKDIYNGEKQLVTALPRLAKAASSPQLTEAITKHLKETEGHVARLEQIFQSLGLPDRGKKCKGMEGLLEELSARIRDELSTPGLMVSPLEVTGWP